MIRAIGDAVRAFIPARVKSLRRDVRDEVMREARIEKAGNLHLLFLKGAPYETGYQHGALARGLIRSFRAEAYDYVATLVPVPRALARPMLFYYASAYWRTIDEDLREEIQGIADGAGVHPIEALVATAVWEMLLTHGCSEFFAAPPHAAGGRLIHGYNYDLMLPEHAIIQPYLAAIFYEPDEGLPFATVNTVGTVGANAGLNAAGISVAWENTHLASDELVRGIKLPIAPFIVTLRRLLQYAHTIDEAVRIVVDSLPRPLADIIIIGSASERRAVALETAGGSHALREMEDGAIWSTNCFRSEDLARHDHLGDGRSMSREDLVRVFPRYASYEDLFQKHRGKIDERIAAQMLRDPYPREAEGFCYPNPAPRATISRNVTSFSMIMDPARGILWASETTLPGCQGAFHAVELAGRTRLPERYIAPSGYHHALRCADCFLKKNEGRALDELERAIRIDGETAPLLLMRALLSGLSGDETGVEGDCNKIIARCGVGPYGKIAAGWISKSESNEAISVPFPSAINPYLLLKTGTRWNERVQENRADSVVHIPARYLWN